MEDTKVCTECTKVPFAIFKVMCFFFVFMIVTGLVIAYYMYNTWKSDWNKYKCTFLAMPFAGFIDPKTNAVDNFNECLRLQTEPMIKNLTKKELDSKMQSSAQKTAETQQEIKATSEEIKASGNAMKSRFSGLYELFQRMVDMLQYVSHKIQNFFYKLGAIIWSFYFMLISSINLVMIQIAQIQRLLTVLNALIILGIAVTPFYPAYIPLGIILAAIVVQVNLAERAAQKRAFCCFTPDTVIDMNNEQKPIKNIKLGDVLCDKGIVTGIVSVSKPQQVCVLGPHTKVTGDHLYLNEHGCWETVENKYIASENTEKVICLVTSTNKIHSGGFLFRDYEETSDKQIQTSVAKTMLENMNNQNTNASNLTCPYFENGEKNNCIPVGTLIKIHNGKYENIENIQIGSRVSTGKVIGKYKCLTKDCEWTLVDGVVISPRIICYSKQRLQWVKAYTLGSFLPEQNIEYGYHLITESSKIELENGLIIRDFVETTNVKTQENICYIVSQSI